MIGGGRESGLRFSFFQCTWGHVSAAGFLPATRNAKLRPELVRYTISVR